ncbi:MAG: T9SS type A sorting domain-containing protein [Bacteroidetes bacterium]|nr:T9SS type A sorting domain-containing protein [Bacteroidota bacterium]
MKKHLSLIALILFFVLFQSRAHAQVFNPGFEQLNNDGTISNWGNVYIFQVVLDSNGTTLMDSIVFDNQFYAPTIDAYSGNYAMEMRNAFNYTTGTGIAGSVSADTDSVYTAWGSLEFIPIQYLPSDLSFYFKFFPVNGDTGNVTITIYDANGGEIGSGSYNFNGLIANYTYLPVPITYTGSNAPALYSLNFSTTAYGSQPSFGTRLLIDDVSLNGTTDVKDVANENIFILFPNPVNDLLHIHSDILLEDTKFRLFDVSGKIVFTGAITSTKNVINTLEINPGIYFLELSNSTVFERKLVVISH